jgi:hypothetical protein
LPLKRYVAPIHLPRDALKKTGPRVVGERRIDRESAADAGKPPRAERQADNRR